MTKKKDITLHLDIGLYLKSEEKMKPLKIAQLAKMSHVKVETVRYYERRGLSKSSTA